MTAQQQHRLTINLTNKIRLFALSQPTSCFACIFICFIFKCFAMLHCFSRSSICPTFSSHLSSGAVCIPLLLPLTVLLLIGVSRSPTASLFQWPPAFPSPDQLWHPLAPVLLLGWIGLHAALYFLPLGKVYNI